ncbi:hypothetical protein D3C84_596620 [compost metagenome]
MQRQRPAQRARQILQVTCTVAHQVVVGALLGVQRPDHAVEGAPAGQGATAVEYGFVQLGLHTAAPEQQGVVVFQPVVVAQAGGDGLDLLGFADDEQEAGFVAPEVAVARAQGSFDRRDGSCSRRINVFFREHLRRLVNVIGIKPAIS